MENGYLDSYDDQPRTNSNHKRSSSVGILSRLPFLRTSFEVQTPPQELRNGTPEFDNIALSLRQARTRKRKGSLRKTALLGTGKKKLERRSSKSIPNEVQRIPPQSRNAGEYNRDSMETVRAGQNGITSGQFSFEDEESTYAGSSTTSSSWTPPTEPPTLGLDTQSKVPEQQQLHQSPSSSLASPVTSPLYASTTDDDEGLTFTTQTNLQTSSSLPRTRSSRAATIHKPSPLQPRVSSNEPPPHNYSETEWWGWIILIVTWIVFVVGMGSCLGVWSWAWDVGETPYAPPELEDDPTLPIVGYYPTLIVMTGVMAWVWVVVAWVGMKYFRHAKVWDGEE